jgi:uncharacterized protein
MFKQNDGHITFKWSDLGDLENGRPNLGLNVPVLLYRLLQYTWRDVMIRELGADKANDIIIKAGKLAGEQFCRNMLDIKLAFNDFISLLQKVLRELNIGILRIEKADIDSLNFTLTVAEDLDCSGLHFSNEIVCQYDEGFLAGILEAYTGKPFHVKEIDCWASGDRVCRFDARSTGDVK